MKASGRDNGVMDVQELMPVESAKHSSLSHSHTAQHTHTLHHTPIAHSHAHHTAHPHTTPHTPTLHNTYSIELTLDCSVLRMMRLASTNGLGAEVCE